MMNVNLLIVAAAAVAMAGLWRVLHIHNVAPDARADVLLPAGGRVDVELGCLVRDALGNGTGGATSLRVTVCPEQIRALLESLQALAQGTALRWLLRVDGRQAVLHLADDDVKGDRVQLIHFFDGRWPAKGALRERIAFCEQIVTQHGGRIYAAPSPLGQLTLTVRLPLPTPSRAEPCFIAV